LPLFFRLYGSLPEI